MGTAPSSGVPSSLGSAALRCPCVWLSVWRGPQLLRVDSTVTELADPCPLVSWPFWEGTVRSPQGL